jgi:amino acid permease
MSFCLIKAPQFLEKQEGFGFWTSYFFMINCVIGAGFLSLPWAYSNGGWLFCTVFQVVISGVSYYLYSLYLEVMARVDVLIRLKQDDRALTPVSFTKFLALVKRRRTKPLLRAEYIPEITNRRLDAAEIVKEVFGGPMYVIYVIGIFCFLIGSEVAYASIFSSSLAAHIPLGALSTCDIYAPTASLSSCRVNYRIFTAVFSVLMVYFTIKGFSEQVWMQSVMTFMRFLVMVVVISASLHSIATHSNFSNTDFNNVEWPPAFNSAAIGKAIPILFFANMFTMTVPSLAEVVKNRPYTLPRIGLLTVLTCGVTYLILGLAVSFAVYDVPSMSNIAFSYYSAGYAQDERPIWTVLVEYIVLLFPALDVVSSFPLYSIVLSDNLFSMFYGQRLDKDLHKHALLFCKLLSCLPALVIAFFVHDLGHILDWTGLFGFYLILFMVPVLHIVTRGLVPGRSEYDTWADPRVSLVIAGSSVVLGLIVAYSLASEQFNTP